MTPIKRILWIMALTSMWSPSFLFIKLALRDLGPLTIAATRVSLSSLMLLGILLYRRQPLPKRAKVWLHMTIMAIFSSVIPFGLFSFSELTIDSSTAAMINGSSSMFTAILAHFFIASDSMSWRKGVGIGLSILGLCWILGPAMIASFSGVSIGLLAAVGASMSYGVSHVYGKKFITGQAHFVAPTAQLLASSLILIPLAYLASETRSLALPAWESLAGVCGLALMGTFLAYILYYRLLEQCGATAISMVACFFPVVGVFLGYFFLEETLTMSQLMACGLILVGVMIVNELITFKIEFRRGKLLYKEPL